MHSSAIILAGGFSSRFGQDKGLVWLANKPLVRYVLDAVKNVVDERIVVVSSRVQAGDFVKVVGSDVSVFVDVDDVQCPLAGALTGFGEARGKYGLLLPCDSPFVSRDVLLLLFDLCVDRNAVVPRWPNGYIEPLHAVYCVESALEVGRRVLGEGRLNMRSMVDALCGVRYVSTLVLEQWDPGLRTFFNVNTPLDLKRAEGMLRSV